MAESLTITEYQAVTVGAGGDVLSLGIGTDASEVARRGRRALLTVIRATRSTRRAAQMRDTFQVVRYDVRLLGSLDV